MQRAAHGAVISSCVGAHSSGVEHLSLRPSASYIMLLCSLRQHDSKSSSTSDIMLFLLSWAGPQPTILLSVTGLYNERTQRSKLPYLLCAYQISTIVSSIIMSLVCMSGFPLFDIPALSCIAQFVGLKIYKSLGWQVT